MLAVVYLIFNEGYGRRGELADEALRLGQALTELMPDEPEAHGLLALMLLLDARREARLRRPAEAAGISECTARKWLGRWRSEGERGQLDRGVEIIGFEER